jgi:hypothetical protein
MHRLRILTWQIHGSYFNTLARLDHDWLLPVVPGAPEGYGGRGKALITSITDPTVLALPSSLSGLDQFMDSADVLENVDLHRALRRWIGSGAS